MSLEDTDKMLQALQVGLDTPGPACELTDREAAELIARVMRQRSLGALPARRRPWSRAAFAIVPALTAAAAMAYVVATHDSDPPPSGRTPRGGSLAPRLQPPAGAPRWRSTAPATNDGPARPPTAGSSDSAERDEGSSELRGGSSGGGVGASPAVPRARTLKNEPAASATSPEDLLLVANRLRRNGEWAKAEQKYLEVTRAQPGTLSSYVALASVGSLRLGRDPRSALQAYERARSQNPSGPLDADIRWGIANAQRSLGNASAEQRELEGLLRAHPGAPNAERARARLDSLQRR